MDGEAYNRSLSERVRLNRQILENKYWFLPVDDKGHGNFVPVGRGVKSSDLCGKVRGLVVCKNVEGHKGLVVKGVDCSGKGLLGFSIFGARMRLAQCVLFAVGV